jgi:tricorn protease interacting factor F2/3
MPDRRYDLSLEFSASDPHFRGRVILTEDSAEPEVTMDAEGLAIESVDVEGRPVAFEVDEAARTLRIRGLAPRSRTIAIAFSGQIDPERPAGIYRTPLGSGEAITTHFEPAFARRMFPCRDRPDAKAVFALEVVAPAGTVAISNMPSVSAEPMADGRQRTRFAPTPAMSTYLLYLGVGAFEEVDRTSHGHRVIAATAPGLSRKAEFLIDVAARSLAYFGEYYRTPFPLPKMHLLGIPKFLSGAMENWGAITFAEPFLLLDDRSQMVMRQACATTTMHEVAHQWFGDLVTMRTWDDLWLNESFATFTSYKARHALFPEWGAWEDFLATQVGDALLFDSLGSTHPIHVDVTDASRAPDFFDEISYGKGAAVLRMLEGYVGESAFRDGVSLYLKEHAGGNASAADLWGAVARSSKEPIDRVMPEWILRPGFPVIRVRLDGDRLHMSQQRFSLKGTIADRPWPIPLSFTLDGQAHHRLMEEPSFTIPARPDSRLLVGPGRTGFYRVRYEGPLWQRLLESYPKLEPTDRWGVLNDAMTFLLAGEMGLPDYLGVLGRVVEERSAQVVTEAYTGLTWLLPIARRVPPLEHAFREIFVAQSDRLGFEPVPGEPAADTALRERVHRARVALDPEFARRLAKEYPRVDSLDPSMTEAIYQAYAAGAGPTEYAELRRRLRESPPGPAGRAVASGLALLNRDDWLLECLDQVRTGEMQLSSWVRMALWGLWFNPDRSGAYWTFFNERLEQALPKMSAGGWTIATLLEFGIPCVGLDRPEEMRRWVADHPFPEGEEGAKKGLDLLDAYTQTLARSR